ncbi:MAG: sensor histidine kinase [Ignavibacteriae bacterium]|nr:MAG: sensor histidine kinase [Ignavibacteriota bacterium]
MKKKHSLFYHIVIFVLAQLAWLALLGLWIYWYVYNNIVFEKVGDQVSPQVSYDITNVVPFVVGLVLLSGLSFTTSLIFRHLSIQLRLAKLYDNFISNVTHELKSPLSSIQLYLETLTERNVPPDKQKEFIGLMTTDVNRLNNLINSILEISALEQKKLSHDYQVQDAESTIKNLLMDSVGQFRLPDDAINISGSAPCEIVTDAKTMKIVLDNLVDNAIKYSLESVKIDVKLSCNLKKFIIEFSDNGIGIPPGEFKKVFNKFHRIQNNNVPNVKGTGLGLYWTKEIIRNHGGKISVLSEGEDKGTKFTIELPVYGASKKRFVNKLLKRK